MDFMFIHHLPNLHHLAALVSAIVYFLLGLLWFSPVLFGQMWREELQKLNLPINPPNAADLKLKMGLSFLGNFVAALAMALLVHVTGSATLHSGLELGLLVGIGFIATSMGCSSIWANKSLKLALIKIGYPVVGTVITAIILSLWH